MGIEDITNELEKRIGASRSIDHILYKESSSIIVRIGSIVLGLLTMLIIILVPIIVGLEIVYICFPVLRDKIEDFRTKLIDTKGADKRLLGVAFRDAKQAVEEVYCNEKYNTTISEMLWLYCKIKVKSIIFIYFIVSLVYQGSDFIIKVVWDLVGNLITLIFH